ncbi:MAG: Npun_R1517 family heterocyst differentiation transcriptional regulator [Cyanobacteria bacterium P01_E01_bin.6]
MTSSSLRDQPSRPDVGIYDCELRVKFTMIEEKWVLNNREHLLEILLDALACGTDEYLESHEVEVRADEVPETSASASMRRQIIRLKNSDKFA